MTTRWVLSDPATAETWTMPINPDSMTSPWQGKTLKNASANRAGLHRPRTFMSTPSTPVTWEWSGVIRSKQHHDDLLYWAQKDYEVQVTDHLGRTWEVAMNQFIPEDRKPMANVPWRLRYTMKVFILRRVS